MSDDVLTDLLTNLHVAIAGTRWPNSGEHSRATTSRTVATGATIRHVNGADNDRGGGNPWLTVRCGRRGT